MGVIDDELMMASAELDAPDEHLIDLSEEYEELTFAIEINGIGSISLGDIQAIKAKAKQGKTYLVTVFAAAILCGECVGVTSTLSEAKVLFFDTEQNKRNTAKVARRVHSLCEWNIRQNNDRFRAYSLRDMDSTERLSYIKGEVERERPTVVFIDGIRDLLIDFNDQTESTNLIQEMMTLSQDYNIAIVNILHTNKGKDDNNMRGHLGTELVNKSSDVFAVQRTKDGTFNVEQTDSRNIPVDDFAFRLNEFGLPIKAEVSDSNPIIEEAKGYLAEVLNDKGPLSRSDLARGYQDISGKSRSTAFSMINKAIDGGFLYLNKVDGLINLNR